MNDPEREDTKAFRRVRCAECGMVRWAKMLFDRLTPEPATPCPCRDVVKV